VCCGVTYPIPVAVQWKFRTDFGRELPTTVFNGAPSVTEVNCISEKRSVSTLTAFVWLREQWRILHMGLMNRPLDSVKDVIFGPVSTFQECPALGGNLLINV
jgi:hypothetical protein